MSSVPAWSLLRAFDAVVTLLHAQGGSRVSRADVESVHDTLAEAGRTTFATAVQTVFDWLSSREESGGQVTRADTDSARTALLEALGSSATLDALDEADVAKVLAAVAHEEGLSSRDHLSFWINDEKHVVRDPDPRTLLLDYLRSDAVGLTGTKKVCAQGGCGACTVTLSRWNARERRVEQTAINSCLRPLCAVDGMAVTTVEGVGSTATELSPVQYQIAIDNGSQCGYCTPGWVMAMHSHLVANPDAKLDQDQIEKLFDGNLCRCTGFRPILYAMRHFADDWGPQDEEGSMRCRPWPSYDAATGGEKPLKVAPCEPNPLPAGLCEPPAPLRIRWGDYLWLRVLSLAELERVVAEHGSVDDLKLIVGNTSIGIYGEPAQDVTYGAPHVRVDISDVAELHGLSAGEEGLVVGAATTYSQFLAFLDERIASEAQARQSGLDAVHYMAHRTAGRIVRDAASLAGNTMLVVRHVQQGTPFPSDMFTALVMMGASVDVTCPAWRGEVKRLEMLDFASAWASDDGLQKGAIVLRYHIPWTRPGELARTFKVALREVNAHSIVNGGLRVRLDDQGVVTDAAVVYGGATPIAIHLDGLERWMIGRAWDAELLRGGLERVRAEMWAAIEATRERMSSFPDEGFTDEYRVHLAESYFYQYFLWVAEQVDPDSVPSEVWSAGVRYQRPVSKGKQAYEKYPGEYPVNAPYIKAEAFMQATGEAKYTHDTPLPRGGLEGAFVLATQPLATWSFAHSGRSLSAAELSDLLRERHPGFAKLVTAADVPAQNDQAGDDGPADPLIVEGTVTACGQVLAIVLAQSQTEAINIAYWVQTHCVAYEPVVIDDVVQQPVLTLKQAIEQKSYLITDNIWGVERSGSELGWRDAEHAEIDGVACAVVQGAQMTRLAQMHFYLETQSALATPGEEGRMTVLCSTQNPDTITGAVAGALGIGSNQVDVQIRRVGGGYGGKGPRSPWAAANAAIAAVASGRAVKIACTRETDSALFGHDNPLLGEYAFAIGTGADDPDERGRLMGLDIRYSMDAGNTADCSPVVMDCTLLRADNGYYVPNYRTRGWVYTTNLISNTSFRSLDAISGILILEDGIEAAAHAIGMLPEAVREKNLYSIGDFTPYGEVLDYCYLSDVWQYAKKKTDFQARLERVREFNRKNRWRKRGISMMPIKYGMGYNTTFLERGDALVDIYDGDGTVVVRHGGCEIGQGLNTQVMQLVAEALNIPVYLVQVGLTSTSVIPNPISTGASTGTAFNGGAAQKAAQRLKKRLEAYCVGLLDEHGREWCADNYVNFWDYEDGWNTWIEDSEGDRFLLWTKIVSSANGARVNLSTQAQHNETGGERVDTGLQFHPGTSEVAQNFVGYTYSVGCTEVEVNILTGETTILRTDLIYDMGKSINPATDVGQIEGAFVQGAGRILTEDLVWQPDGPLAGTNNTPNTWGYKIPATTTVPLELNVDLFPREDAAEVPENPNLLMSAKEVGEPPLCLAATIYFALKHALLDSRTERGKPGWFHLDLPCTVQRVREAAHVEISELTLDGDAAEAAK